MTQESTTAESPSKTERDEEVTQVANGVLYLYDRFIEEIINYADRNGIDYKIMRDALSIGYGEDVADYFEECTEDES